MRACLSMIALLAACGSKAPPPRESSAPTPVDPAAEVAAQFRGWADRACACDTTSCASEVVDDVDDVLERASLETFGFEAAPDDAGGAAELGRLIECTQRASAEPYFLGVMLARGLEKLKNEVCACTTSDCAQEKAKAWLDHYEGRNDVPLDAGTTDDLRGTVRAWKKCVHVNSERFSAAALKSLDALREAACACTDSVCADEVDSKLAAWTDEHKDQRSSADAADRAGAIAAELHRCLASARGETLPP